MIRIQVNCLILAAAVVVSPVALSQQRNPFGQQDQPRDLRIDRTPNSLGEREIEMRPRLDPDPTQRYRGTVDRDGSTRLRNLDGDTLRGNIDSDGSGRLRDRDGNSYRVRPR